MAIGMPCLGRGVSLWHQRCSGQVGGDITMATGMFGVGGGVLGCSALGFWGGRGDQITVTAWGVPPDTPSPIPSPRARPQPPGTSPASSPSSSSPSTSDPSGGCQGGGGGPTISPCPSHPACRLSAASRSHHPPPSPRPPRHPPQATGTSWGWPSSGGVRRPIPKPPWPGCGDPLRGRPRRAGTPQAGPTSGTSTLPTNVSGPSDPPGPSRSPAGPPQTQWDLLIPLPPRGPHWDPPGMGPDDSL